MLEWLEIHHIALIEEATLRGEAGLTVFTGETGAGKSLLIHTLDLVSGGRGNRDMIRNGAESARIDALFSDCNHLLPAELLEGLRADGLLEEDTAANLTLSREIWQKGKNICRINGRLVSLQRLHEVASYLIDIQSQRDQALIYDPRQHILFLDRYAGKPLNEAADAYRASWMELRAAVRERRALGGEPEKRSREAELLRHQVREIEALAPRSGEDERLRRHRDRQQNAERIGRALAGCQKLLNGDEEESGILTLLDLTQQTLKSIEELAPEVKSETEALVIARESLHDCAQRLERCAENVRFEPELLAKIEARLDQLAGIKAKYGETLEAVIDFRREAEARLLTLTEAETRLNGLDRSIQEIRRCLVERARQLTDCRQLAASRLEEAIKRELQDLGMPNVRFSVVITALDKLSEAGRDNVRFMIQPNPGETLRPLDTIASGGESSRILLAIRAILAQGHANATLVFDEVDAGISGETSAMIGEKLIHLAKENQVFCVTHSAQLAAMGASHILIEKRVTGEKTSTSLQILDEGARRQELSRLLAGAMEDRAVDAVASGLLARGRKIRERIAGETASNTAL